MSTARNQPPVLGAGLLLIGLVVGFIMIGPAVDASSSGRPGHRGRLASTHDANLPVNDDYRFGGVLALGGTGPGSCVGDIDENGFVDFQDLLQLLAGWSPEAGSCPGCAADLDGDDDVDFQDLLILLAAWGSCP